MLRYDDGENEKTRERGRSFYMNGVSFIQVFSSSFLENIMTKTLQIDLVTCSCSVIGINNKDFSSSSSSGHLKPLQESAFFRPGKKFTSLPSYACCC